MNIKWFGTATVIISEGSDSVLFDPFVSMNESISAFTPEDAAETGNILITHGHFDHLADVPALAKRFGQTVHCSKTAAETLIKNGVDVKNINTVAPGDRLKIGAFNIVVFKGRHIKFDLKLIRKTLINPRIVKYRHNLKKIIRENRSHPAGDVLVFGVEAGGKNLLIMGSLNTAKGVSYPKNADVLVMPFQGRSDINRYALGFVRKLRPKAVYLHHFDDTFPPVSGAVDLEGFLELMKKHFPETGVIVPGYGKPVKI